MPFQLRCACGKNLQIQDEWVGKKIRCSNCNVVLTASHPANANEDAVEMAVSATPTKGAPAPAYDEYVEDDERPRSKRRRDEDDENDDDDDDRPRRSRRQRAEDEDRLKSVAHMPGADSPVANIGYGILMMVGAVIWFVVGAAFDTYFIYAPFLFIAGIVAVVRGALKRS